MQFNNKETLLNTQDPRDTIIVNEDIPRLEMKRFRIGGKWVTKWVTVNPPKNFS